MMGKGFEEVSKFGSMKEESINGFYLDQPNELSIIGDRSPNKAVSKKFFTEEALQEELLSEFCEDCGNRQYFLCREAVSQICRTTCNCLKRILGQTGGITGSLQDISRGDEFHQLESIVSGYSGAAALRQAQHITGAHDAQLNNSGNMGIPCVAQSPAVEKGVQTGSPVVARIRGRSVKYVYGVVESLDPLCLKTSFGEDLNANSLAWVALAKDDGWLEPHGLDWQEPGVTVIFKLLKKDEWVSAKVARGQVRGREGVVDLLLEGVEGLEKVRVQEEVALLFTPHIDCQQDFNIKPMRGGTFVEHLANAFICESDTVAQRIRWAVRSRSDGQYPMRGVWVHPRVKQQALQEFVTRCHATSEKSEVVLSPEIVMVLGAPASGKSSISRLPHESVPEDLRETVATLKYRQEVNNDNLTNCMPGFVEEYREAFEYTARLQERGGDGSLQNETASELPQYKDAAWALEWLVYLLYHHGPVRDSFCWDVITATVVDAAELPVFYTSVMSGKQIGRTMQILELAHSAASPVPHTPLRFVGFWPYASSETRYRRQNKRHGEEVSGKQLLGGNADSNLVDMNYHQQQSEANITKLMACLNRGVMPTDDDGVEECTAATNIASDHFLMIDNDGGCQRILLDFSNRNGNRGTESYDNEVMEAARAIVSITKEIPVLHELCRALMRIATFFVGDDSVLQAAQSEADDSQLESATQLLPFITEVYEVLFERRHRDAPTTHSGDHHYLKQQSEESLDAVSDLVIDALLSHLGSLRKFCCAAIMREIRDSNDQLKRGRSLFLS
jgi:hypothetical protein